LLTLFDCSYSFLSTIGVLSFSSPSPTSHFVLRSEASLEEGKGDYLLLGILGNIGRVRPAGKGDYILLVCGRSAAHIFVIKRRAQRTDAFRIPPPPLSSMMEGLQGGK
jgi:hypothetical protein